MTARILRPAPVLLWLLIATAATAMAAESPAPGAAGALRFTLHNQPAGEALQLLRPLLSPSGSAELAGADTVVVRDEPEVLQRAAQLLRAYDHPPVVLRVVIQVVRAGPARISGQPAAQLPEQLLSRLRELLRYDNYEVLATAGVEAREGTKVTYDLADGSFSVGYRMGTVLERRVKLHAFRLARTVAPERSPLINTTLNLWLDQTMILGLARDEASPDALMVVLTCGEVPTGPATRPR